MVKVEDIAKIIERLAPLELACDFDNSGLCVGAMDNVVTGVLLSEDITMATLEEAVTTGCNLVVSHHPSIFKGIKRLLEGSFENDIVLYAIKNSLNLYCAHTNLDSCVGGINESICDMLGGTILLGQNECYRIASLPKWTSSKDFADELKDKMRADFVNTIMKNDRVKMIAVASGSGGRDDELVELLRVSNVDTFVTAEVKHSIAIKLKYYKINLFEFSHFDSEKICKEIFRKALVGCGVKVNESLEDKSPYDKKR